MTGRRRYALLLPHPERTRRNLEALHAAGAIDAVPTLFQVFLGVLYMRYRIVFRSETIGVDDAPVRQTRRARLLARRWVRAPFLARERVVAPFDLTGLAATPEFLHRHLIGAYHPGENALYDLALLTAWPGRLEALRTEVAALVEGHHPRGDWLRDLVVYEGYHERLLGLVDQAIAGDLDLRDAGAIASDASLRGFVAWCCNQPATPAEALAAWREGELSLAPSPP